MEVSIENKNCNKSSKRTEVQCYTLSSVMLCKKKKEKKILRLQVCKIKIWKKKLANISLTLVYAAFVV